MFNNFNLHFNSNAKGWVTDPLFIDYIVLKLESELQEYSTKENLAFKTLIIDNVPGQLTAIEDHCEHIKIMFIPCNSTFLIHPMDQGVISTLKTSYLKKHLICW